MTADALMSRHLRVAGGHCSPLPRGRAGRIAARALLRPVAGPGLPLRAGPGARPVAHRGHGPPRRRRPPRGRRGRHRWGASAGLRRSRRGAAWPSVEGVGPAASVVTWSWAGAPDETMTDEDVVDQFLASSVDSAESLLGRNARGEVPKPARHLCRGGQTRWCRSPSRVAVDDLVHVGLD